MSGREIWEECSNKRWNLNELRAYFLRRWDFSSIFSNCVSKKIIPRYGVSIFLLPQNITFVRQSDPFARDTSIFVYFSAMDLANPFDALFFTLSFAIVPFALIIFVTIFYCLCIYFIQQTNQCALHRKAMGERCHYWVLRILREQLAWFFRIAICNSKYWTVNLVCLSYPGSADVVSNF